MKKSLLLAFLFIAFTSGRAQTINCTNFCVLNISFDTVNHKLNVIIFNGDTNSVNYPTVIVTDVLGDTVGNIGNQTFLFAHNAGDTVIHTIPSTLLSFPSGFTGSVYLTDQSLHTTCMYSYPMSCTVGVPELSSANYFSVYPNPASDNFTIDMKTATGHNNAVITISDISGQIVKSYSAPGNQLLIDREGLQSGMYFISVTEGNKRFTNKLIIK